MNKNNKYAPLTCDFTIGEQIYAQVTFHLWWLSGFIGIFLQNPMWAIPYMFIVAYGILGVVQRHLTCPRCPHLHEYGSCLQLHPGLSKLLIKEKKNYPFSRNEKILFVSIFLLITIYPIYWLMNNNIALAGYVLFGSMWYSGQLLFFCKRCRIPSCPFNRAKTFEPLQQN
jgi:hypothetical protein